jgi:hypothetical protein
VTPAGTSPSSAPAFALRDLAVFALVAAELAVLVVGLGTGLLQTPLASPFVFAGAVGVAVAGIRGGWDRRPVALAIWVGAAAALATVSTATGLWNGLTDEAAAMPAFLQLYPNLYARPLVFTFSQYGTSGLLVSTYYVYLPLLPFVQVPWVNYRWTALLAWAGTVYILRRDGRAVLLLGGPWAALLAANGFNDLVPLAVLTAAYVGLSGWSERVARVFALGLKQFANLIVVGYALWQRDWRSAALAAVVTALFLLPFAWLDPGGVYCHAILLSSQGCAGSGSFGSVGASVRPFNYFLWPAWVLAVLVPADWWERRVRMNRNSTSDDLLDSESGTNHHHDP